MATPNYSYEKRQKELAKKRKKEDKLKRKADGKPDEADDGNEVTHSGEGIDGQGTTPSPATGMSS